MFKDAIFSPLRLKLSVIRSLFTWVGLFQRRISNLLDCFVLGSMAMPRMWNFWVGLFVSFFYRCPFLFVWLFVASLVYVLYSLSFWSIYSLFSDKKKKKKNLSPCVKDDILFILHLILM